MKNILGLDLGTNSIGWAVVQVQDGTSETSLFENGKLCMANSRVIPMSADVMSDYDKGNSQSQTADRRQKRAMRRLLERFKLRRERLNRVLNLLGYLPAHYAQIVDRFGKIDEEKEVRIPWIPKLDGKTTFLFKDAYLEMLSLFKEKHPELKSLPYDWTLYYLRSKALRECVSGEELAWILHSFNQKRGYNPARDEMVDEEKDEQVECLQLRIAAVNDTGAKRGKLMTYEVVLENGYTFTYHAAQCPDWVGELRNFIIKTKLDKKGCPLKGKDGKVRRTIALPADDDWMLVKTMTERLIEESGKEVGEYVLGLLLADPSVKIKGGVLQTIDRSFYKRELERILDKQVELHAELRDMKLYEECLGALYAHNVAHRQNIRTWGFRRLLVDDVIFYQRPLKSKKSLISECPYEAHEYWDKETNEKITARLKCIPASHPLYQEFRLWQFLGNLRIIQREGYEGEQVVQNKDITSEMLTSVADYERLFEWMNCQERVTQKTLLKFLKLNDVAYRWNYVEEKIYPGNETHALILSHLKKSGLDTSALSPEQEYALWHILYSVKSYQELYVALRTYAQKNDLLVEDFANSFVKCKPFGSDYGAYSEKAIRKMLPLMRRGKYWSVAAFDKETLSRVEHLITGEEYAGITQRVREQISKNGLQRGLEQYQGLPVWLVCYIVYGRHSEAKDVCKFENIGDLEKYIANFRQHSLRNPIVEQVVLEALRTVRDIWREVGQIDEIHVELARELKLPAKERAKRTSQNVENETRNLRIKALLEEFMNPDLEIENVRPYSPSQQELLKIYEEGAFENAGREYPEDIASIIKNFQQKDRQKRPSLAEVKRYKLWLEQNYRSPYTGEMIPLGRLFTTDYQIEHVIPQSRYFDDSLNNKVICEAEVNRLKGNQTAGEFIKSHGGEIVTRTNGRPVKVFSWREYEQFVNEHYRRNLRKRERLLADELPEGFTNRQLNDSRYISKFVTSVLSNIVRERDADGNLEQEAISKNLIVCTGQVTDRLKHDWGLNDVWNDVVRPRFERLNQMRGNHEFGQWEMKDGKRVFQINVPLEYQRGFSKKRIDHRHHALDAIVIACASREIIHYLNNLNSGQTERNLFKHLLCVKAHLDDRGNYRWDIKKPWGAFTQQVASSIAQMVVSFKQNQRIVNKATNYHQHYNLETGKKEMCKQTKGEHFAIRKPLHKDTVYGRVNLRSVQTVPLKKALEMSDRIVDKCLKKKVRELQALPGYPNKLIEKFFKENTDPKWLIYDWKQVQVYRFSDDSPQTAMVATRKLLDASFGEKQIKAITDTGIQQILLRHLEQKGGDPQQAFSPEGIVEMNMHIRDLNGGKPHQPIRRVRVAETLGLKFVVGEKGNRKQKYVEAAKGTNLFFAIYKKGEKRVYETIPLNVAIERVKQGCSPVPEFNNDGCPLLFYLSPNDLVYLPTQEELENGVDEQRLDMTRVYKMVSSTEKECYFIPHRVAVTIVKGFEYGSMNKIGVSEEGLSIKEFCTPLYVDRLGRIKFKK